MNPKIKVELFCTSNSHFLQRIYTGFRILAQRGEINLSYKIFRKPPESFPLEALRWNMNLLARANGKLVLFDMNDDSKLWRDDLTRVDFYFKRSFSAQIAGDLAYRKVFPAGLSYVAYEKYPSWFSLHRLILSPSLMDGVKETIRTLGLLNPLQAQLYRQNVDTCHAAPDLSLPPRVIYMTRFWDPHQFTGENRETVHRNNQMRAACVRQLRREFGARFFGGFGPAYLAETPREYADCLLEDSRHAKPGRYLRLMRQFPIGVDTRGLNASSHKFSEYLAFGRAIVSEKKVFETPELKVNKHYLDFSTPQECVAQVARLMDDAALRHSLMNEAYGYYRQHMPPQVSMRRALDIVTADTAGV